uniref:Uncharacterized protein n=1 Tax=Wuchereria bancrofti TaxID=6293 RepID=A0AAF5Q5L6_WUCBA
MGFSNSNGGISRKQNKRSKLPSLGVVARRATSRCGLSRQNRTVTVRYRATNWYKYANRITSFFKPIRPQKQGLRCHGIVAIIDKDNGLCYFAQIRALQCNQFGERFVSLIWLVSTESADEAHHFDAEHFVHALFDSELHEQMEERVRSVNTIPTKLTAFDEKIPLSK